MTCLRSEGFSKTKHPENRWPLNIIGCYKIVAQAAATAAAEGKTTAQWLHPITSAPSLLTTVWNVLQQMAWPDHLDLRHFHLFHACVCLFRSVLRFVSRDSAGIEGFEMLGPSQSLFFRFMTLDRFGCLAHDQ